MRIGTVAVSENELKQTIVKAGEIYRESLPRLRCFITLLQHIPDLIAPFLLEAPSGLFPSTENKAIQAQLENLIQTSVKEINASNLKSVTENIKTVVAVGNFFLNLILKMNRENPTLLSDTLGKLNDSEASELLRQIIKITDILTKEIDPVQERVVNFKDTLPNYAEIIAAAKENINELSDFREMHSSVDVESLAENVSAEEREALNQKITAYNTYIENSAYQDSRKAFGEFVSRVALDTVTEAFALGISENELVAVMGKFADLRFEHTEDKVTLNFPPTPKNVATFNDPDSCRRLLGVLKAYSEEKSETGILSYFTVDTHAVMRQALQTTISQKPNPYVYWDSEQGLQRKTEDGRTVLTELMEVDAKVKAMNKEIENLKQKSNEILHHKDVILEDFKLTVAALRGIREADKNILKIINKDFYALKSNAETTLSDLDRRLTEKIRYLNSGEHKTLTLAERFKITFFENAEITTDLKRIVSDTKQKLSACNDINELQTLLQEKNDKIKELYSDHPLHSYGVTAKKFEELLTAVNAQAGVEANPPSLARKP